MIKKMIFLLALGFSNTVQADCITDYANLTKSRIIGGSVASLVGTGAIAALKSDTKKGAYGVTAAAGIGTSINQAFNVYDANSVLNLLREAEVGKGLYLTELTSDVNERIERQFSTEQIAQIIVSLNHSRTFCSTRIPFSYGEIRELIINTLSVDK